MRKVEQQMVDAIVSRTTGSFSNTLVRQVSENTCQVFLHGNLIAQVNYDHNNVNLYSAGWKTTTTKSRLNAVLAGLHCRVRVYQSAFAWFVGKTSEPNPSLPFFEGIAINY